MAENTIRVRVKRRQGISEVLGLASDTTVAGLKRALSEMTGAPANTLSVLTGYPPRAMDLTQDEVLITACGVRSGDTIIIREPESPEAESVQDVKIKSSHVQGTKTKVSQAEDKQKIDAKHCTKKVPKYMQDEKEHAEGTRKNRDNLEEKRVLCRMHVPADNSCLFSSVSFALSGNMEPARAQELRDGVARIISLDPKTYDSAILGRPTEEYVSWISDKNTWGGGIELSVLSKHLQVEIIVFLVPQCSVQRFGENDNYSKRIILVYDGNHYEPLYDPHQMERINVMYFSTNDETVLKKAEELTKEIAMKLQSPRNNGKDLVRCNVCGTFLQGTNEATKHAKKTFHTSYSEVNESVIDLT